MADDDVNGDSDDVRHEKSQKKAAKYDSGAADLEKVTDYAEEKEISSSDGFTCVSTMSPHVCVSSASTALRSPFPRISRKRELHGVTSSTRPFPFLTRARSMKLSPILNNVINYLSRNLT